MLPEFYFEFRATVSGFIMRFVLVCYQSFILSLESPWAVYYEVCLSLLPELYFEFRVSVGGFIMRFALVCC